MLLLISKTMGICLRDGSVRFGFCLGHASRCALRTTVILCLGHASRCALFTTVILCLGHGSRCALCTTASLPYPSPKYEGSTLNPLPICVPNYTVSNFGYFPGYSNFGKVVCVCVCVCVCVTERDNLAISRMKMCLLLKQQDGKALARSKFVLYPTR